jgi:predicted lipoprotein with Yx(FWY)xxD motif
MAATLVVGEDAHMRQPWRTLGLAAVGVLGIAATQAQSLRNKAELEDYVREPMPQGFQVVVADFEGPVFTDANGKTLYTWPANAVRNGDLGDRKGMVPTCDETRQRVSSGLQSPYPAGLELPEVDTRPSCLGVWPAVYAAPDAKAMGKWGLVKLKNGRVQWTYEGFPVYTSTLDRGPGDVLGGQKTNGRGDARSTGVVRQPIGPRPNIPPQFAVSIVYTGRLLVTADGRMSVYVWDGDTAKRSNCDIACRQEWTPMQAPEHVRPTGEWAMIENSPGFKQWTFRGKPVYTRVADRIPTSLEGGDTPGWHNVWTQKAPEPPKGFIVSENSVGELLGDEKGRTLYTYQCNDDAVDQLDCSHPSQPQVYRLAVSGKGDPDRAQAMYPYVIAAEGAVSTSHIWSVKYINPDSGRWVEPGDAKALRVWAYRDRPIYLCARDQKPGDFECDSLGENFGLRNGYRAFFLRSDFGGHGGE